MADAEAKQSGPRANAKGVPYARIYRMRTKGPGEAPEKLSKVHCQEGEKEIKKRVRFNPEVEVHFF